MNYLCKKTWGSWLSRAPRHCYELLKLGTETPLRCAVPSWPNDNSGEANAVVLLLPGCGHLCLKNIHPMVQVIWSFKGPSSPMLGLWQGRLVNESCEYHGDLGLLQAAKSDVSPYISLPTTLLALALEGPLLPECSLQDSGQLSSWRVCPPLWLSVKTLLARAHLSRWQARVSRGPFALGAAPLANHHAATTQETRKQKQQSKQRR